MVINVLHVLHAWTAYHYLKNKKYKKNKKRRVLYMHDPKKAYILKWYHYVLLSVQFFKTVVDHFGDWVLIVKCVF